MWNKYVITWMMQFGSASTISLCTTAHRETTINDVIAWIPLRTQEVTRYRVQTFAARCETPMKIKLPKSNADKKPHTVEIMLATTQTRVQTIMSYVKCLPR